MPRPDLALLVLLFPVAAAVALRPTPPVSPVATWDDRVLIVSGVAASSETRG